MPFQVNWNGTKQFNTHFFGSTWRPHWQPNRITMIRCFTFIAFSFPSTSYFYEQVNLQWKSHTKAAGPVAPKSMRLYTRSSVQAKFRHRPLRASRTGQASTNTVCTKVALLCFKYRLRQGHSVFSVSSFTLEEGKEFVPGFLHRVSGGGKKINDGMITIFKNYRKQGRLVTFSRPGQNKVMMEWLLLTNKIIIK
jgi:hypothetical protein